MVSPDLINQTVITTFERRASSSVLNLIFLRTTLRMHLCEWTILGEESLNDHRYVGFELQSLKRDPPRDKPRGRAVKKFDRAAFAECIWRTPGLDKTRTTNDMTRYDKNDMSRACDASMFRKRQHKNQRPAFSYPSEVALDAPLFQMSEL